MQERLAACAENLRKAVRYLANSSCTPQQKLIGMYNEGGFGRICQDDLPEGFLKDDYLTIRDSLIKTDEPNSMAKIAAMSDEQARKVMDQICSLSGAVSYVLGEQFRAATENANLKKGMKLSEFTPVITEYEDACGFPDEQSANSYCREMNNQSFGWTVEKALDKWRVVWLGERVLDVWEKKIGNLTVTYSTEGTPSAGYTHGCDCRRGKTIAGTMAHTSGKRLTRDEIEKLPSLAQWVARYT
jgi:hypothetical protein